MGFPQSFIDDLRMQADIVQVVQEYVSLRKSGATYKGLCPFHSEKTPVVSRQPRQRVFSLLRLRRRRRRLQVPRAAGEARLRQDAVRHLASKFGMPIPEQVGGRDAHADAAEREALLKVHERAAEYFQAQLCSAGRQKGAADAARPRHHGRNDQETRDWAMRRRPTKG